MAAPIAHSGIPVDTDYRLEVNQGDCPEGQCTTFALARSPDGNTETWTHGEIWPGPRTLPLSQRGDWTIEVVAAFDGIAPAGDCCEVRSTVEGLDTKRRTLRNNALRTDVVEISIEVL